MSRLLVLDGYRRRSGQRELVEMAVAIAEQHVDVDKVADLLAEHSTAIEPAS